MNRHQLGKTGAIAACAAAIFFLAASNSFAAFNAYLDITGIPGESIDAAHKDWIEVLSYSWGVTQGAMPGSTTTGGSQHRDFTIVKPLDKATPKLFLDCCRGDHITSMTLVLTRTGFPTAQPVFMSFVLRNVIVSSVAPHGTAGGQDVVPLEEVTFRYGQIEWTYNRIDAAGAIAETIKGGWDVLIDQPIVVTGTSKGTLQYK